MANDPNIPLATRAPPLPPQPLRRIWIGFLLAAGVFACLLCMGIGGWWLSVGRGPGDKDKGAPLAKNGGDQAAVGAVGGKDNGGPIKNVKPENTKPPVEWNYQDIQDRLASKGMTTRRGQGIRGMWFIPSDGGDDKPLSRVDIIQGSLDEGGPDNLRLHRDMAPADKLLLAKAGEEIEITARLNSKMSAEEHKQFNDLGALHKKQDLEGASPAGRRDRDKARIELYQSNRAAQDKRERKIGAAREALDNLTLGVWEKSPVSSNQPFLANDYGSPEGAQKEAARIKDVEQRDVLAWGRFIFQGSPEARKTLSKLLP
jgi:hypothetical protein